MCHLLLSTLLTVCLIQRGTALRCSDCKGCPVMGTGSCISDGCFVRTIKEGPNETIHRGCFRFSKTIIRFLCNGDLTPWVGSLICCNDTDYCNQNLTTNFPTPSSTTSSAVTSTSNGSATPLPPVTVTAPSLPTPSPTTGYPQSMNISLGEVAEFNCGASNALFVTWFVNRQRVNTISSKSFAEVRVNGTLISTLRVVGSSDSNGAVVTCYAILYVGRFFVSVVSEPALILVQGLLDAVNNLIVTIINSTTVLISWSPPFTLEGVPILGYNVTITNTTSGENETLSVKDTTLLYSVHHPFPKNNFTVTVVPLNGAGAGNMKSEPFFFFHHLGMELYNIEVPGGASNDIQLHCGIFGAISNIQWFVKRPGATSSELVSTCGECTEYQFGSTGFLNINGVRARNEGVYYCRYNQSSVSMTGPQTNVTVLGVPSFIGCLGIHMCNTGTVLRVNESEHFNISISLVFQYGGPRGVNQPITRVTLVNTVNPNLSIFFCTMTSNECTIGEGTSYTGRLTYSGQRSPWSDITVTIANTMITDNGTYIAQVDFLNPNGLITTTLSSTVTISVFTVPLVVTEQEPYHLRNSTITILFTLNQRVFPSKQSKKIQWTFTTFPNVSRILNTSCPECYPRYNFSDDLLSLTITNLQVSDDGNYTLQASNEVRVDYATHKLTVFVPAKLASEGGIPLNRREGGNLTLTCASDGIPRPNIRWTRDGAVIDQNLLSRLFISQTTAQPAFRTDIRGHRGLVWGSNSTLTITDLIEADSGSYSCQTSNIEQVLPTRQNPPHQLTVNRAVFNFCKSEPCQNEGTCLNLREDFMCICTVDFRGKTCIERNLDPASPTITMGPSDHSVNLFSKINLTCISTGSPSPSINWFRNDQQLIGKHMQYLTIPEALLTDRGVYHCVAINSVGTATSRRAVVNFKDIVQYTANMSIPITRIASSNITQGVISLISQINVQIGGERVGLNSTFFTVQLKDATLIRNNTENMTAPMLLTILTRGGEEAGEGLHNKVAASVRESKFQLVNGEHVDSNAVVVFDRCPAESTILRAPGDNRSFDLKLSWPVSLLGDTVKIECPCEFNISSAVLIANRTCGGNFVTGVQWLSPHGAPCEFIISAGRRLCRLVTVRPQLKFLSDESAVRGLVHHRITLSFATDNAFPNVLPENISWKFRRSVDGTTIDLIREQTDSRFEFSSDRKSLVISNLTLEDTGQYTITATNEVGSDSYTVTLSVEAPPSLTPSTTPSLSPSPTHSSSPGLTPLPPDRPGTIIVLYTVLPLVLGISIVLLALITTFCCIYKKYHHQVEENVYEQVTYATVPPLPPQRIQTRDNPAYVRVELTDCIAYGRSSWLQSRAPPQNLPTIHQVEDEQEEQQQDRIGVDSIIDEAQQSVGDITSEPSE